MLWLIYGLQKMLNGRWDDVAPRLRNRYVLAHHCSVVTAFMFYLFIIMSVLYVALRWLCVCLSTEKSAGLCIDQAFLRGGKRQGYSMFIYRLHTGRW